MLAEEVKVHFFLGNITINLEGVSNFQTVKISFKLTELLLRFAPPSAVTTDAGRYSLGIASTWNQSGLSRLQSSMFAATHCLISAKIDFLNDVLLSNAALNFLESITLV